MNEERWATFWLGVAVVCMIVLWLFMSSIRPSFAHDHDHPEEDEWYKSLMMPDIPTLPCCGKADAYWCDDYYARDGKAYCKITDDRAVPGHPPIPVGTEVEIPTKTLKWDKSNPTGHAIVFMTESLYVWCFVQNGGV